MYSRTWRLARKETKRRQRDKKGKKKRKKERKTNARDKKEEDTVLLLCRRLPLLLSGSAKRLKARYKGKEKETARGREGRSIAQIKQIGRYKRLLSCRSPKSTFC